MKPRDLLQRLALEVGEAETAIVDRFYLPFAETLRQEEQLRGRGRWLRFGFRVECWLNRRRWSGPRCGDFSSRLRNSVQRAGGGEE